MVEEHDAEKARDTRQTEDVPTDGIWERVTDGTHWVVIDEGAFTLVIEQLDGGREDYIERCKWPSGFTR